MSTPQDPADPNRETALLPAADVHEPGDAVVPAGERAHVGPRPPLGPPEREEAVSVRRPAPRGPAGRTPAEQSADLGAANFPTVWRGYEPSAVDAYVRRVDRTISELAAERTPQDVVRRALDRVGEQTSTILREADETAERMTAKSRAEADDRVQGAEREANDITARARSRLRDLDADIDRIWLERQRLIDDTRKLADRLLTVADNAEERFPPEEDVSEAARDGSTTGAGIGSAALDDDEDPDEDTLADTHKGFGAPRQTGPAGTTSPGGPDRGRADQQQGQHSGPSGPPTQVMGAPFGTSAPPGGTVDPD